MTEQGVIIEIEFRIERNQLARFGDHERINFHLAGIGRLERLIEAKEQFLKIAMQLGRNLHAKRQFTGVIGLNPRRRVDRHRDNFFGRVMGNILNIHAAFFATNKADAAMLTIKHGRKVKLRTNVRALLDINPLDFFTLRPGLVGNQNHAQHFFGEALDLIQRFSEFHAARLTAPAGMDLRFHHP